MPVLRQVLTISLVASLLAAGSSVAEAKPADTFVDDDTSRYEPYIERAVAEGLISGCNPPANDRFCPDRIMTRGEYAVMLAKALEVGSKGRTRFRDMRQHPAERAVKGLEEIGVAVSCGRRRFCPDNRLQRAAMAALTSQSLGWKIGDVRHSFVDLDGHKNGDALAVLARKGAIVPCDAPVSLRVCPDRGVTRAEAVFSMMVALQLDPAASPTHKPDSPPLDFADNFKGLKLWDHRSPSTRNRVSLTENGYSGSGLRVNIARGSHFGADFRLDLSDEVAKDPEGLFFRYYLRLDPDWETHSSGKLPGFSGIYNSTGKGGYPSSPSSPGWSARIKFSATSDGDPRAALGYYVYHLGQEGRFGDGMSWNEAGRLVPGEWYCLEGEVQINKPGLSDGVLRAWVDETPAFEGTGLQFRRPGEPNIAIESFWFNVYYGGPSVAQRDLGLTVDSVKVDNTRIGCGAGTGLARPVHGDLNRDGFEDLLGWGACPVGTCFKVRTPSPAGPREIWRPGSGAWLSLDTHRLGMAAGDVDGDGDDDLLYSGRCRGSTQCWRVHPTAGSSVGVAVDWGAEARFGTQAEALVLGDWDGDGFDDLGYQGLCGRAGRDCWRVHMSDGETFGRPADWGPSPRVGVEPRSADINGDGRDDVVYAGPCDGGSCWFGLTSTGSGFSDAVNLGKVEGGEKRWSQLADFDGDGRADLFSIERTGLRSRIEVRTLGVGKLGPTRTVHESQAPIIDVSVRPASGGDPAQVLVTTDCAAKSCVKHLFAWSSQFVKPSVLTANEAMSARLEQVETSMRPPIMAQAVYRYLRSASVSDTAKSTSAAAAACDADPYRCA